MVKRKQTKRPVTVINRRSLWMIVERATQGRRALKVTLPKIEIREFQPETKTDAKSK